MQTTPSFDREPPLWARALTDPKAFAHEQAQLGKLWTLLGVATDLARDGDWIRATLGGRSVFVQRFGDTLRGFENVCAHRFYPLRTEAKGNGPIRCGFHHWQYNKEGQAIGIPKCQEMFGVSPRELGAQLRPIDIATCGILVFGRFPSAENTETLEQSFGDAFTIVQAMWDLKYAPYYIETPIAANWKLCYHITLDDYHIVAVHPDTFGKDGYLPLDLVRYHRIGRHSAYFWGGDDNEVAKMAEQCRRGEYRPRDYRILQMFPNMLTLQFEAERTWYVLIQQYVPVAPDRALSRSWYFPAPFPAVDKNWFDGVYRRVVAPFTPYVVPFYIRKIFHEDNSVCEGIQTVARQIDRLPIFGRHEERVAWFEEVYAREMADAPAIQPEPELQIGSVA